MFCSSNSPCGERAPCIERKKVHSNSNTCRYIQEFKQDVIKHFAKLAFATPQYIFTGVSVLVGLFACLSPGWLNAFPQNSLEGWWVVYGKPIQIWLGCIQIGRHRNFINPLIQHSEMGHFYEQLLLWPQWTSVERSSDIKPKIFSL